MREQLIEEQAILELYEKWKHAYLNGDIPTYGLYLDDLYHFIGSTGNEEFLNKDETIRFFVATADQLNGKAQIRNNKTTIEKFEGLYFITEVLDAYFLSEGDWSFYGRFRFSSVLQNKPGGWRFIYQHFSTPDTKAQKGETIGFEQVSEENRTLREAIRRRTLELEQKNRELEIEAALDKVRSVSIGMQNSDQLADVVGIMYRELHALRFANVACELILCNEQNEQLQYWSATTIESFSPHLFNIPRNAHPFFEEQWHAWSHATDRLVITLTGKEKKDWDEITLGNTEFRNYPEEIKNMVRQRSTDVFTHACFRYGLLEAVGDQALDNEQFRILRRFADVFEQAYTRFLDLQKAEVQARDAQIELAVERVRARALAMHKSEEIMGVLRTLWHEVTTLQIPGVVSTTIYLKQNDGRIRFWDLTTLDGTEESGHVMDKYLRLEDCPDFLWFQRMFRLKEKYAVVEQDKEELKQSLKWIEQTIDKDIALSMTAFFEENNSWHIWHPRVLLEHGIMNIDSIEPPPAEAETILTKMGAAFDLAYKRFLDLQNAEARAHEAKIEAALERVRATTMAMHKSDELANVVRLLYGQLEDLGFELYQILVSIFDLKNNVIEWWSRGFGEVDLPQRNLIPVVDHPLPNQQLEAWKSGMEYHAYILQGDIKRSWEDYLFTETDLRHFPEEVKIQMKSLDPIYLSDAYMKYGALQAAGAQPLSEEKANILVRFAKVFDQAYTRMNDLFKAEKQARDAQIEAALERVRSRSMAMHHSGELVQVVQTLFDQMASLGFVIDSALIMIFDPAKRNIDLWISTVHLSEPTLIKLPYDKDIQDNAVIKDLWHSFETGEHMPNRSYKVDVHHEYFRYVSKYNETIVPVQDIQLAPTELTTHLAAANHALVGIDNWQSQKITEEEFETVIRFANVFDQAYVRFLDLLKAEERAEQAVLNASLQRVRAETASMRTTKDLERINPMIWKELTTLAVPFIRCGVFIIDENEQLIHAFLSGDDGTPIGSFHLPFDISNDMMNAVAHWRKHEILVLNWDRNTFIQWTGTLMKRGLVQKKDEYIADDLPEDLHLHFIPFKQGLLYVGSTSLLSNKDKDRIQYLADAFSTAYARYEDFYRLEQAKKQVDKALSELKQAQTQLVQAEKMASLGELTAGIAHEIQNPLNFVNNFSEINSELAEEIEAAVEKGDLEEIRALANDIRNNQQKISEHGKRADSIVKNMLQHSRSSSGNKETTDLNKLAEEYLRLAYHGYRAREKNFNTGIRTDLAQDLPALPLVAQDIGRVLLNLFNNALYAVQQQLKNSGNAYAPEVSLITRYDEQTSSVLIKVSDNGSGIPDHIKDKIFQPFFTTKPTGEGTGLGLSLSYDIVKAHGGDLKVESEEGKGSSFIIELPAKS